MDTGRDVSASDKQEGHRHVRIHPECSLCGYYFEVGEPMVSLLGDRFDSTCQVIDASTFPMAIYCNQRHGTPWTFCQFPKCTKCASELESVTVHRDCFQIFLHDTVDYKRITAHNLWHAAHARYPWRGFWPLPSTMLDADAASLAMRHAAAQWHMPSNGLPSELQLIICDYLQHSLFWRYILAKEFIRNLIVNSEKTSVTTTVTLSEIDSWSRGSAPKNYAAANKAYIRLTMDSLGLCEIERLAKVPEKSPLRSETHAYVVDSIEQLGQMSISFKLGRARLYPRKGMRPLRCWDTPGPPLPPDFLFPPDLQPICPRLGTIETQKSFGITFFISSGQIAAIHAHTVQAPSAYSCFQRLNPVKKRWVAWIFVPIRGGMDKFGFRTPLLPPEATLPSSAGSLLLQMTISGEVVLGPYLPYGKDLWMDDDTTTLIHGVSRMGAVYPLGLYPRIDEGEDEESSYRNPMNLSPPFEHAYFSYAELDDVSSIEIYHDKTLEICRGVIVRYANGGERALGQCRIGVDSVRVFEQPMCFCFKETRYLRQGTRVKRDSVSIECNTEATHSHSGHSDSEGGWTCCTFPCRLEWWFTSEESRISFTPGRDGYR